MQDIGDIAIWIIGALSTFVFFNYKAKIATDNEKFARLFANQREIEREMTTMAAEVKGTTKLLDEMHEQTTLIGKDITEIKVSVARLPKRDTD